MLVELIIWRRSSAPRAVAKPPSKILPASQPRTGAPRRVHAQSTVRHTGTRAHDLEAFPLLGRGPGHRAELGKQRILERRAEGHAAQAAGCPRAGIRVAPQQQLHDALPAYRFRVCGEAEHFGQPFPQRWRAQRLEL